MAHGTNPHNLIFLTTYWIYAFIPYANVYLNDFTKLLYEQYPMIIIYNHQDHTNGQFLYIFLQNASDQINPACFCSSSRDTTHVPQDNVTDLF